MNLETPKLAVDCIVLVPSGLVLIERQNPPYGYALPGGFVDVGETCSQAAIREMKEELNLDVTLLGQLGVYDKPDRDPRQHVVSVVFVGTAEANPVAGDDAKAVHVWANLTALPRLAFDHEDILLDFKNSDYHKHLVISSILNTIALDKKSE
jgi:8-oxo-dGTP diphosphatase